MTYISGLYQNHYLQNPSHLNNISSNPGGSYTGGAAFNPTFQSLGQVPLTNVQNITGGLLNSIGGGLPVFGGNTFINNGFGSNAGFPQSNVGPLLLQTGGGKGGKKGQNAISVLGGYGLGNQGVGNFNTGGPLLIQTGGGKGGKKGLSNLSLVGGYGVQPGNQTVTNNYFQGAGVPNVPHNHFQQQQPQSTGVLPHSHGGSNIFVNNPGNPNFLPGNQIGGVNPLILQTGGGKGGKKGLSNIALLGGYGLGNQGFGNFNTGGPLLLQTGGGKGGKKGLSNIAFVGGYGIGGLQGGNTHTVNNFFQNGGSGFTNPALHTHHIGSFGHYGYGDD